MTPEEQNKIAATLAAHENVLAIILSYRLEKLSPDERRGLMEIMNSSPDHGLMPKGLNLDIDAADELAGLALEYRDAINRLYGLALAKVEGRER